LGFQKLNSPEEKNIKLKAKYFLVAYQNEGKGMVVQFEKALYF
jgi:hypothetical protein